MEWIKPDVNVDFMRIRKWAGVASAIAVLISIFLLFEPGPRYGIDFKGGTEIQFTLQAPVDIGHLRALVTKAGFNAGDLVSIGGGNRTYRIRLEAQVAFKKEDKRRITKALKEHFSQQGIEFVKFSPGGEKIMIKAGAPLETGEVEKVLRAQKLDLREVPKLPESAAEQGATASKAEGMGRCIDPVCPFGPPEDHVYEVYLAGISGSFLKKVGQALGSGNKITVDEIEWVGPKVGREFRNAGIRSILYALGLILIYVAFRFDLRFAPGAVLCLVHDVLVTTGIFIITRREIVLATVAALLTIVGYSLNDTIVVFDRIRENLSRIRERELRLVVNKSINETLSRTILTSFTTLLAVIPILFITRGTIQNFAFALCLGVIIGTYSTIYIASPIALWIDQRFFQKGSR